MKEKILKFIEQNYKKKFTGRMEILKDDISITLKMYFLDDYAPLSITLGTTDEKQFLDFVFKELKSRRLDVVKYYKLKIAVEDIPMPCRNKCNTNERLQ